MIRDIIFLFIGGAIGCVLYIVLFMGKQIENTMFDDIPDDLKDR